MGDLELHPGIAAEGGYDSNYFQRADEGEGPVIAAWRLRLTPSLSLGTLGPQRLGANPGVPPVLRFRATAFASFNELIAADPEFSDEVSEQRHIDFGGSLDLDIAPRRPLGADLYASFIRIGEPSNLPTEEFAFDRGTARGGAGITFRPGGGLFEWRFGYEARYNYFEAQSYRNLDNLQHSFNTRGRWLFLPRTALVYDGAYTLIRYTEHDVLVPENGEILRSRVGLSGLITNRFAFLGMIGWLATFYDAVPENESTLIAHAEARYFVMPQPTLEPSAAALGLSSIAVGYLRDVSNAYLSSFYRLDRFYLNFSYLFGGTMVASLEGGYAFVTFPDDLEFEGSLQHRIEAGLFAENRLSDGVGLNATVRYDANMGDTIVSRAGDDIENLDYERWQAYLGLRVFW
nr:MAG: hypothetical protein DIU78_16780 [Pseudomonadota bacterium]